MDFAGPREFVGATSAKGYQRLNALDGLERFLHKLETNVHITARKRRYGVKLSLMFSDR